jgi:gliding motility-associated-like protein
MTLNKSNKNPSIKLFIISCIFRIIIYPINAQVMASFEVPDTVCVGQPFQITNTSEGAQTFNWRFCALDLGAIPSVTSLGTFGILDAPVFSQLIFEQGAYFVFLTNHHTTELIRLDFGESINNTPTITSLGNFPGIIPIQIEGLSIQFDNGNWWGFALTGGTGEPSLIRFNFGSSITNFPTVENLGNIGNLSFPHELFLYKEDNNWLGITVNRSSNSLTRFNFGNSLSNIPVGENLGNIGSLNTPVSFMPLLHKGSWHFFICNASPNTISRLDFGTSLLSTPTGVSLGAIASINTPRDILIFENCGEIIGLVLNAAGDNVSILDFQNNIFNVPLAFPYNDITGLDYPHSFSNFLRTGNDLSFFVVNVNNDNLTRFSLESCDDVDPLNSTNQIPPAVTFGKAGKYIIELIVDEGLSSQSSFCKMITVVNVDFTLGNDTTICKGEALTINSNYPNSIWQDGTIGSLFEVENSGWYVALIDTLACNISDSVFVNVMLCDNCYAFPNAFTPDGDGQNDHFSILTGCNLELIAYELAVFNRWGQKVFESIHPENGWNGLFNGHPAPTDTYIWISSFSYMDFESKEIITLQEKGNVTLVR